MKPPPPKLGDDPLSEIEVVAIQAANQACDILKAGFYSEFRVQEKRHRHDLVTEFDLKSEKIIVDTIKKAYPHHAIVAEESGIQGDIENQPTWIIDPIDGTWNFAKQIPSFAISIATYYRGKVHLGLALDPISGELFLATYGGGATMNGKPIYVSNTLEIEDSGISLATCKHLRPIHALSQIRRSGSSVLDLCYVAKGALEGFIYPALRVWDYAASSLIIEEAGGTVTNFQNQPLTFPLREPSAIVATNGKIHGEIIQWISMENK